MFLFPKTATVTTGRENPVPEQEVHSRLKDIGLHFCFLAEFIVSVNLLTHGSAMVRGGGSVFGAGKTLSAACEGAGFLSSLTCLGCACEVA